MCLPHARYIEISSHIGEMQRYTSNSSRMWETAPPEGTGGNFDLLIDAYPWLGSFDIVDLRLFDLLDELGSAVFNMFFATG